MSLYFAVNVPAAIKASLDKAYQVRDSNKAARVRMTGNYYQQKDNGTISKLADRLDTPETTSNAGAAVPRRPIVSPSSSVSVHVVPSSPGLR